MGKQIPEFEIDNRNKKGEQIKAKYTGSELDMEVIEKLGEFLDWFQKRGK